MIGSGMMSYMSRCYFPCLCSRCAGVVQVNLLAQRKRYPQCKSIRVMPYDDASLSESTGMETVTNWNVNEYLGRNLKITNGNYKCPQCENMTLHFTDSGMNWD